MAKRYYWLKLKDDFFRDKRIKKLRKIAGGDTYVLIYLKIQLLSLKNEGVLEYEGVEDSFASELALELDEDEENVEITINFLQTTGLLLEGKPNEYALPQTQKAIGSEGASAKRVREHRKRKKQELLEDKPKPKRFKKPTIQEIKEYCKERNNNIDAEQFYHFYEAKNWKVGKNKMKSWKSAIITWEKRNKPKQTHSFDINDY